MILSLRIDKRIYLTILLVKKWYNNIQLIYDNRKKLRMNKKDVASAELDEV